MTYRTWPIVGAVWALVIMGAFAAMADEGTERLQRELSAQGYYHGEIDGIYGSETENAIAARDSDGGRVTRPYDRKAPPEDRCAESPVTATGPKSRFNYKSLAIIAWSNKVASSPDLGLRYTDFKKAADPTFSCYKACPDCSYLTMCDLTARPCN